MTEVREVLAETESKLQKSVRSLEIGLNSIRTGRASPILIESILVDYYGVPTRLNQIANVSVPQPQMLMVQPWDKQVISAIEKSILKSDLGLVPNSDGAVIRINIPSLTEERRLDLVRLVGRKIEDAHVAARNIRRESLENFRKTEKQGQISQDEGRRAQEQLQALTDACIAQMDEMRSQKDSEIMEV